MKKNKLWLIPLIMIAVFTPFSSMLDLAIARYFYHLGEGNIEHFVSHPVLDFIYVYALIPGQILVIGATIALFCSYIFASCKPWRPHALYLVLTLAVGSGFIVHSVLKEYWGRPRPKQVIEFGGQNEFRPYYKPNFNDYREPKKSFTCGHCSMGFYFFALAFMGRRFPRRWLIITGFSLAWGLGIILSLTRMAQGGHFLSDVLFSGIIMWYSAMVFDWMVYEELT